MKPQRIIPERHQSPPAVHPSGGIGVCRGETKLRFELSHTGAYGSLIVERCSRCGRVISSVGVLPDDIMLTNE